MYIYIYIYISEARGSSIPNSSKPSSVSSTVHPSFPHSSATLPPQFPDRSPLIFQEFITVPTQVPHSSATVPTVLQQFRKSSHSSSWLEVACRPAWPSLSELRLDWQPADGSAIPRSATNSAFRICAEWFRVIVEWSSVLGARFLVESAFRVFRRIVSGSPRSELVFFCRGHPGAPSKIETAPNTHISSA